MKEGQEFFFDEFGIFTKIFSRCAQSSSSFAKTFLYVRQLVNTQTKGIIFVSKMHSNEAILVSYK